MTEFEQVSSPANRTTAPVTAPLLPGGLHKAEPAPSPDKAPEQDGDLKKSLGPAAYEQLVRRQTVVDQYMLACLVPFTAAKEGKDLAIAMIEEFDAVEQSRWQNVAQILVGSLLASVGSLCGGWVAGLVGAGGIAGGALTDGIQQLITSCFTPEPALSTNADMKLAFQEMFSNSVVQAQSEFVAQWPNVSAQIHAMSPGDVEKVALKKAADGAALIGAVRDRTLVAWTNFVAQAKHGRMTYDYWDDEGGGQTKIATADADKTRDVHVKGQNAKENIDPSRFDWAMDNEQATTEGEHFGLLEIHMWTDGQLVGGAGYGMRLDNVGPQVRKHLAKFGTVRELPVNKVVRVYVDNAEQINPPKPSGTILLTTDNFIRRTYFSSEVSLKWVEVAQNLSLSNLTI